MTVLTGTISEVCELQLHRLAAGLDLGASADLAVELFRELTDPWNEKPVSVLPMSDVSPDGSPVEFAAEISGHDPSLQFAIEPMATEGGPAGQVLAARRAMEGLANRYSSRADQWMGVAGIFLPAGAAQRHVAMYGAEISRSGLVGCKVWFYPSVTGWERAQSLMRQALALLQLEASWQAVQAHAWGGFGRSRPILFSLDLTAAAEARTKIYFRHYGARSEDLVDLLAPHGFEAVEILEFCRLATGGRPDFDVQPAVTCLSLTPGDPSGSATLYVPLWVGESRDDLVRQRTHQVLTRLGHPTALYDRCLAGVARRPLSAAGGLHNYISLRPAPGQYRVKAYWSPELHSVNPPPRYRADRPPLPVPAEGTIIDRRSVRDTTMETPNPTELVLVHTGETYQGKQGHTFFAGISRETAGSRGLCMHAVTIPPGAKDKPHLHENHESAIYIISGQAEGWYGEDMQKHLTADAGDFVYIPAGVPHQPANRSQTEPLIAIVARTDPNEQESVIVLNDPKGP